MKQLVVDTIMLAVIFALSMLGARVARCAPPCPKWYEVHDGKDVQTNEPVECDGMLGPKPQFAELLKCATAELPACQTKLGAEHERAGKVEAALKEKVGIEKKRADQHAEENARLREKLEQAAVVEWHEHTLLWVAVGAAVVGIVWGIVEAVK